MSLIEIGSIEEFDEKTSGNDSPVVVGFFGAFSKVSREAEDSFRKFAAENPDIPCLYVDVTKVRGLHKRYGITGVPTVIGLSGSRVTRKISGKQSPDYYFNAFVKSSTGTSSASGKPAFPPVTVWVSDTCPWCSRVKSYLRKLRVPFREVNVSRNPSEAEALRARTGQIGVPQLQIGGKFVVGFDKPAIDRYLGINSSEE